VLKKIQNKKFLIQEKVTQAEFDALEKRKIDSMKTHGNIISSVPNKLFYPQYTLHEKHFCFIALCMQ
jgi:hypothetical protein